MMSDLTELTEDRLTVRIKNIVEVPSCELKVCYCCVWKAVKKKGKRGKEGLAHLDDDCGPVDQRVQKNATG